MSRRGRSVMLGGSRPMLSGPRDGGRRVSGLGVVLVLAGVVALASMLGLLPDRVERFWPVLLIGVGVFGLLRRPGWVQELDFYAGPQVSRVAGTPRRIFSWFLIGAGAILLLLTTHAVDERVIGPGLLVALGVLLIWRRAR